MPQLLRPSTPEDIPQLVELLLLDADVRNTKDGILWKMIDYAPVQSEKALKFALTAEQQPFRQIWQVSEHDGAITGVIHSMLLPVRPIYAGRQGDPGVILPDSVVALGAPEGTV